jgi:hypothetical protein
MEGIAMKRRFSSLCAATLFALAGTASAADIDVMLQNQYLGTDLTPVITSPPELVSQRVIEALENVAASLPAERLSQLAALIRQRSPHAVVLNEAFAYTCTDVQGTPVTEGCGNQRIKGAFVDFLASTETNLAGRYVTKARVRNFAIAGLPFEIDGYLAFLTVQDRDAILVRRDVAPGALPVPLQLYAGCRPSLEGCNYQAVPTLPTALGPITIERGYAAVDLQVGGQPYRIFGTHLEVRQIIPGDSPLAQSTRTLQRMQAAELAQLARTFPAAPGARTLVVGDINSADVDGFGTIPTALGPLPPPYAIFAGSGFTDVWTKRPAAPKGMGMPLMNYTCCQAEDLSNAESALDERIDIIFSLAPPTMVPNAVLLGESMGDKTVPRAFGLWPSDHASVAALIQY